MRRLTTTAVLLLGFSAIAGARTPAPAEPQGRHCLWRAVGPGGTVVFLLGSIHALPDDAPDFDQAVERAFTGAGAVFFEIDMTDESALGARMMAAGALPPDRRLGDVLDPETRTTLDAYLEESGLSFSSFEAMKPWMAALTITSLELMKAGFSAESGIDIRLARRARAEGKRLGAFETADYQIGLFAGMNEEESRAFLRYTLKDLQSVVDRLDELTTAWGNGDLEVLTDLLTEALSEEPELFEKLVTTRNRNWLPQIEKLLEGDEPALVVVGALHLVGPMGLVSMLEERGIDVEQL